MNKITICLALILICTFAPASAMSLRQSPDAPIITVSFNQNEHMEEGEHPKMASVTNTANINEKSEQSLADDVKPINQEGGEKMKTTNVAERSEHSEQNGLSYDTKPVNQEEGEKMKTDYVAEKSEHSEHSEQNGLADDAKPVNQEVGEHSNLTNLTNLTNLSNLTNLTDTANITNVTNAANTTEKSEHSEQNGLADDAKPKTEEEGEKTKVNNVAVTSENSEQNGLAEDILPVDGAVIKPVVILDHAKFIDLIQNMTTDCANSSPKSEYLVQIFDDYTVAIRPDGKRVLLAGTAPACSEL